MRPSNRTVLMILGALLWLSVTAEARTWRPRGKPTFSGEFQEVQGDNVLIATASSVETVPYASLSRADKAEVKSKLSSQGKRDVVSRLNALDGMKSGDSPGAATESEKNKSDGPDSQNNSPDTPTTPPGGVLPPGFGGTADPTASAPRTWTDVNGNQLSAEFLRRIGVTVELRVNGAVQLYPIAGFSETDQQWIEAQPDAMAANGGSFPGLQPPVGESPDETQGGPPGFPRAGYPGMMPGGFPGGAYPGSGMPPGGYPGAMPPGSGGFPGGFPETPGSATGFPGGYPGAPGVGGYPGTPMPPDPGQSAPGFGGSSGSGFPGPGAYPDAGGPPPGFGSGLSDPAGFSAPPAFEPPPAPTMPELPHHGMSFFNNGLKCEECGAEFTAADGLKEGDDCPKCSGGFSGRLPRGAIKGIVFVIALVVGGAGWVAKKVMGKA